jgi:hypothetical protein
VRFPSRLVLAGSVLSALAASSGTALTMPDRIADAAVAVPDFPATPGNRTAQPSTGSITVGPPVTGAQIAALAVAPARERAATLIAERAQAEAAAAEAERARLEAEQAAARPQPGRNPSNDWREMRERLREACDDGRIRGAICRGA